MATRRPRDPQTFRRYHASDLVTVPGLLSLLRLPLAVLFVLVLDEPWAAITVLAVAGLSDVVDGWYARKFGLISATGAALDPITDKSFAITVAVALVLRGKLSLGQTLLINVRELGELPLVLWILASHRARLRRVDHASANIPGKIATVLQFGAIGSALFGLRETNLWVGATAILGIVAAATYWRRELRVVASPAPRSSGGDRAA
jgi:CDP-diacylglycerol--glycerol-3-phosphate 3-phosphatidyltransferase/cardiolipin synthase